MVPSDLATQWSVDYETLFLASYNDAIAVARERFSPLMMEIPMGDHQGNQMTMDWLGAAPQMREWVDEKRAQGLGKYAWSVLIKRYEASVDVDMDTFNDARGNVYEPRFREMGRNAARLPYRLISALIRGGLTGLCYDGQYFYDTDHSEGLSGTQSNRLTGTGTSDSQIETDFYAAKSALLGFKDDQGEVLGPDDFRPLVWIPNNKTVIQAFAKLAKAVLLSNNSNILAGEFDIVIDPSLTDVNDWGMFRTDSALKPFVFIDRETPHYEDNFNGGSDEVFKRRKGMASVVGRAAAAYGLWQNAVWTTNT
jgi:phage major head subunit gpT-like protein